MQSRVCCSAAELGWNQDGGQDSGVSASVLTPPRLQRLMWTEVQQNVESVEFRRAGMYKSNQVEVLRESCQFW